MLLVVRLVAVYALSAAMALWLVHRFVRPLRPIPALFLVCAPLLMTGEAVWTAGVYAPIDIVYVAEPFRSIAAEHATTTVRTPILSDVVFSLIPWRKAVREAAKNGRLPLWNRFQLAGEPLLAVQLHGSLHPEFLPSLLLPLAQGWTLLMTLRFLVSLLSAYLLAREWALGELPALFAASSWAFCDFLMFFEGYAVSPAIGPLPLLFLGLRRLAREPGRKAVALTVATLLLMITAGHPESLLHCVAAGGIYFVFELFWAPSRSRRSALPLSFLAGALALGLSAILLLPFAEALPATFESAMRGQFFAHLPKSRPLRECLQRAALDLIPYSAGVSGKSQIVPGLHEAAGYAGSVLWPLAAVGLFSKRREKWPILLLLLVGLGASIGLPGVADLVGHLPLFRIALNDRLCFLVAFGGAMLAALGLERVERGETRRGLAAAGLVAASLLTLLFWRLEPGMKTLGLTSADLTWWFAVQASGLLLVAGVALLGRGRGRWSAALLLMVLLVERRLEVGGLYPTCRSDAFYPPLPVLDPVRRDEPYRFAAVQFSMIPNASALYELEDVRGYESMTLRTLVETFPLWCVAQPVWYNRVPDPTRPFLSFLNVRYFLVSSPDSPPAGWKVLARDKASVLVENPRVLPRAFVPEHVGYVDDVAFELEALQSISDFGAYGIVEGAPRGVARSWLNNGKGRARIADYGAQSLTLVIDALEPMVVATSIPRWPGWKLTVDGHSWPTLPYNHAFIGFRVSAGSHTAVLRYWPDGFAHGLAVSVATALAIPLLTWISRRRENAPRVEDERPA